MKEADVVRTSIMREAAMMVTRLWAQHIRPLPFDRVFYLDGIRVRITIEEYKPNSNETENIYTV